MDCSNLSSIRVKNAIPSNINLGDDVFWFVPNHSCVLYVPKGCKEAYSKAKQWKDFINIEEIDISTFIPSQLNASQVGNKQIYNLQGGKIGKTPKRGIVIVNGKKVVVK